MRGSWKYDKTRRQWVRDDGWISGHVPVDRSGDGMEAVVMWYDPVLLGWDVKGDKDVQSVSEGIKFCDSLMPS